jgi:hypothetical protein
MVMILQIGRFWVLATLGRRWTMRIVVVLGEKLVARGPYRWLRHPNYVVGGGAAGARTSALCARFLDSQCRSSRYPHSLRKRGNAEPSMIFLANPRQIRNGFIREFAKSGKP